LNITALVSAIEGLRAADALPLKLAPPEWQRLGQALERRELQTGDLLVRRGERDRVAYLLQEGVLQAFVSGGPPGSHRLARLRAGAIVGEPALFVDSERMASVEALTPAVVWALKREQLDALAHDEPRIAIALLQAAGAVMAVRMRANLERGIPLT
jgi:CRP/FNR family transcriptional regulator, cyclic AMP receptor protein